MAQSVAGLLYRITSDSSQARTDLSNLTGTLQSSLQSVTSLFTGILSDSKATSAGSSAAFKTLAADTKVFESQLNSAAKSMGVLPSKAREIVEAFSKLGSDKDKLQFGIQFQNFDPAKIAALGSQSQSLIAQQQALSVASEGAGAAMGIEAVAVTALTAVVAAAVVAVVALAVESFNLAKSASDAGSKLSDLSLQSGLSVETLSALTLAAKENSTTIDAVVQATGLLERRMQEAAGGNKVFQQSLALIGVTNPTEQLKDMDGTLRTVIQTIGGFANDGARTALVMDNFGRSGKALIPIIDDVGGDFDKLTEKAKVLGFGFTTPGAKAADEFGDRMTDLGLAVEGLKNKFGAEFFEIFTKIVVGLTNAAVAAQPFIVAFGEGMVTAFKDFAAEAVQLKPALDAILSVIEALIPQTGVVKDGFFSIGDEMKDLREIINFLIGGVTLIQDIVELAAAAIIRVMSAIRVAADEMRREVLDTLGLSTVAVDKDIRELTADIELMDKRLGEGLKNNQKFIADLALVAKATADAQAKIAGGDVSAIPGTFEDLAEHTTKPSAAGLKRRPVKDTTARDDSERENKARLADAKALQAAELALLQQGGKDFDLINKNATDKLKIELDHRIVNLSDFTERQILFNKDAFEEHQILIAKERDLAINSAIEQEAEASKTIKNAELRASKIAVIEAHLKVALAKLNTQENQLEQETNAKNTALRDAALTAQLKSIEDHQKAILDLRKSADSAEVAQIKDLESQRIISAVAAETRIAAIEAAALDRRRAALESERAKLAPGDAIGEARLNDARAQMESEGAASVEEASRRIRIAREKDTESLRKFIQLQNQLLDNIRQGEVDALNRRASRLEERAGLGPVSSGVADVAHQRALAAEEEFRTQQNQRDIEARTLAAENAALTEAQKLEATQAGHLLLEQEENRHTSEMARIQRTVIAPFDAIKNVLKTAAQGFAATAIAALSAGQSIGAAMKQMAAAVIGQIAQIAVVEAIKNLAYAFNALGWTFFTGDPKGAAAASHYFTAAALWGGIAVGAAVTAGAIGKSGGAAGGSGSAGAGTFGGKVTDQPPADTKVKFGDVTGKLGNDPNDQNSRIAQALFSKIGAPLELMNGHLQVQTEATRLQTAAIEKHAAAADRLVTKLSSVSPVDVLTVAAEQAPDVIGRAVLENHDRDGNFTGRVARALQLN